MHIAELVPEQSGQSFAFSPGLAALLTVFSGPPFHDDVRNRRTRARQQTWDPPETAAHRRNTGARGRS